MCPIMLQILGRNLEGLVARAQELKESMKDEFVSVSKRLNGAAYCWPGRGITPLLSRGGFWSL